MSETFAAVPPAAAIEDAATAALDLAGAAGAEAADVIAVSSAAVSAQVRLGAVEEIEREETRDLGLRVFIGHASAIVSTNDLAREAVETLARRAVAMARAAPEDPYAGLAEPALVAREFPDLDLADTASPDADDLAEVARRAEAAAQAVSGITNSLGASASASASRVMLATSEGFAHGYSSTRYALSCSAVAGTGTAMQRDFEFMSARHRGDLDDPETIGRTAAERAVARLDPRKADTGPAVAVYAPRAARSLIGHFASAINGRAIARGTSFLKDRMETRVFPAGVSIVDDPLRSRGPRSRPFDGEGLAGTRRALVDDGRLTGWLLDLATARQLGLAPTGSASRGIGAPPSPAPTNLFIEPGNSSPETLIAGVSHGIYITGLIGMGVNGVTGDYSRGAEGFLIENGEITVPLSEVTVAGNLIDMFAGLVPADDLEFRHGTDAPTLAVEGMTLAGR